jgi:putative serine protease PepD
VVAAVALLTGLVGGAVGGVLVSGDDQPATTASDTIPVPRGSPGPLPAGNASIAAVADQVLPSTVQVLARGGAGTVGGGTGSGFVVDRRGHVITNNHVVQRATETGDLVVVDHKGRRYQASIVGRSPVYDIAVLSVERGRRLPPAAVGAATRLRIGDTVVAIGSPLGLSSTVTSGIVSAVNRPVTTGEADDSDASSYINAVQTDAAINPGNSGGPLVNLRGEVVGVNSAIATTGGLAGESGSIGVGFAIPMEQVRVTANQILATGKAEYPVIGANVDTRQSGSGAKVVEVPNGTPAAAAGLQEGDLVVAVEGQRVTDGIGLIVAIRSHRPGETITLTVRRDGRQRDVAVRLDSKVG